MNPTEPGKENNRRSQPSEAELEVAEGGVLLQERPPRSGTIVLLVPLDIEIAFVPTNDFTKIELRRRKGA